MLITNKYKLNIRETKKHKYGVRVIVFDATFNDITLISWLSVLLGEEAEVSGENHWPVASRWHTLSHNAVSSTSLLSGVQTHNVSGDRQPAYDDDHDSRKLILVKLFKWNKRET